MLIDVTALEPKERYRLMIQSIVPRPVAWVLSDNGRGANERARYNLAPFSYFTGISSEPPLLMMSIGKKPDQSSKDSLVNIRERQHFVVHIAHRELAAAVTHSSRTLPHGHSELEQTDLELAVFEGFALPRLGDCRLALGCRLHQLVKLEGIAQTLVFGRIERAYVADSIVAQHEEARAPKLDLKKLDPIGRLGGNDYTSFGELISVPRPQ